MVEGIDGGEISIACNACKAGRYACTITKRFRKGQTHMRLTCCHCNKRIHFKLKGETHGNSKDKTH